MRLLRNIFGPGGLYPPPNPDMAPPPSSKHDFAQPHHRQTDEWGIVSDGVEEAWTKPTGSLYRVRMALRGLSEEDWQRLACELQPPVRLINRAAIIRWLKMWAAGR